ncbi:MAG: putative tRNA-dihydrouridine synthase [Firmicutes bacterium ADurb.Bin419]|nr:MAG: putative tRNA-dihydrouridine synthase [Firmicutes bacterium ADurb.Bin419]
MSLFLAPIQGMTVAGYRNAYARHFGGIDAYYSPFIATSEVNKVNNLLLKDILPECNEPSVKLVPQLLGNDGTQFKAFACAISDLGYNEINWNIGCPYPTVTSKKKGSGILPYPEMIKKVLDIACSDNSYLITVKMRLGWDNPEEGIFVMKALNEYPLGGVIIHARTGVQMYTGSVDTDSFESLAASCKHEITYNGDIFTYDNFLRISSRFPSVKNFMLGRGALIDPFLPSYIKGKTVPSANKIEKLREFHDDIFNYYQDKLSGEKHLCDKMKEFWHYMHVHIDKDGKFMKKIKKCHRTSEYLALVDKILDSHSVWSNA